MVATKEVMEKMGYFFDEMGAGSSPELKGKWHPEEKSISTGEYFLTLQITTARFSRERIFRNED